MKIPATLLAQKIDIEANMEFYRAQCSIELPSALKAYPEMNETEKANWIEIVEDAYLSWLQISKLFYKEHREELLTKIRTWAVNLNLHQYLVQVENGIVNSSRDPLHREQVRLDTSIRQKNIQYLKDLDRRNEIVLENLKDFIASPEAITPGA